MALHRERLPQLDAGLFLTDGGLETTLIYHEGVALPGFAAFPLLLEEDGRDILRRYYESYLAVAETLGVGLVLDSATWRANPDWGARLGFQPDDLSAVNRRAIELLAELRAARRTTRAPLVLSGCVGPRGDGYVPGELVSATRAADYHRAQIERLASSGADLVTALTLTYADEAVGISRAAADAGIPSVISFTVETDGRLPSGQRLGEAIEEVDADSAAAPAYYMVNCAHPAHIEPALEAAPWVGRIKGVRANASRRSHAELDAATELDEGDPADLGRWCRRLRERCPHLNVLGGCCGTDHRHVEAMGRACMGRPASGGRTGVRGGSPPPT